MLGIGGHHENVGILVSILPFLNNDLTRAFIRLEIIFLTYDIIPKENIQSHNNYTNPNQYFIKNIYDY